MAKVINAAAKSRKTAKPTQAVMRTQRGRRCLAEASEWAVSGIHLARKRFVSEGAVSKDRVSGRLRWLEAGDWVCVGLGSRQGQQIPRLIDLLPARLSLAPSSLK